MEEKHISELTATLDPSNWDDLHDFTHRILDDAIDYVQRIREHPVWRRVPDYLKRELHENAPEDGQGVERAYEAFCRLVLPYTYANPHPRAWGWVIGIGTAQGIRVALVAETCTVRDFRNWLPRQKKGSRPIYPNNRLIPMRRNPKMLAECAHEVIRAQASEICQCADLRILA